MTDCPTRDRLDLWANEQLEPGEQAAVTAHVNGCPRCQAVLDELTDDGPPTVEAAIDPASVNLLSALKARAPTRRPSALDFVLPDAFRLPGYDLLGPIGRGGMGVVYKARQHGVNRVVAVKMLNRTADESDDAARFRHEAEVLGRLRHPNVVQVFEVGVADGRPFLVMEYVAGGSLARWADDRPQPPAVAAELAEQVARAVQHAHDHGVLHRDLKPANILLQNTEDRGPRTEDRNDAPASLASGLWPLSSFSPKVTDFGLAKSVGQDVSLTQTGVIVGTPSYMAPEQVSGEPPTPACDVYGVGAVLYELLTGRPPFTGATAPDVLVQVRFQDPVPPSRVIPTLPRDLNTVCLKCLEKDPQRRYATAAELAEDLRRWRAGEPILARPAGAAERAWKWAKRRPSAAVLVAVALALLFVGLPTVTGLFVWADTQRRAADRELERAERSLYASHIAQAELHYGINDLTRTRYHLRESEPTPGRPDRRGWEWYYLRGLAHAELLDLPLDAPADGRSRALYAVAFSPDGGRVVAGGGVRGYTQYRGDEPGELVVWDTATGRPADGPAYPKTIGVTALAFGPDPGRLFAVASDAGRTSVVTLRGWDTRTGAVLFERTFPGSTPLRATPLSTLLAVDPAGARVAFRTTTGVVVCDAGTGATVLEVPDAVTAGFGRTGGEVVAVRETSVEKETTPDPVTGRPIARQLVVGRVTVTEPGTDRVVRDSPFKVPRFTTWSVSPTGRRAVGVTPDGVARVIPTDEAGPARSFALPGHTGEATAVAVDPGDRLLATGGADGVVRVWDLDTGRPRLEFRGHANRVKAVAFSPDGTRLASVGWDRVVKVWDLTRRPEVLSVGGDPPPGVGRAEDFAFTPDGRDLLVVRTPGGVLERWDAVTGVRAAVVPLDLVTDIAGLVVPGRTAAFSDGGRSLASVTGTDPARVKVWDTGSGRELAALTGHGAPVRSVAISGDGSRAAAASWHRAGPGRGAEAGLVVWDAATGAELLHVPLGEDRCPALALSPDGRRLAAAVRPNTAEGDPRPDPAAYRLRVWDVGTKAESATLDCGEDVVAVAFDATGRRVAAATTGPRVLVWDAASGAPPRSLPCLQPYDFLAFAPDGRRLAGATRELLTLWDPATGEEVLTLRDQPRGQSDRPWNPRVAFGPGGGRLAAAQRDYTVTVWTAAGYGDSK